MHGPHELKVRIHYFPNHQIWLFERFRWIELQSPFCREPLPGPNRPLRDTHKRYISTGKKPIEEMADQVKVILMSNISCLFSAGTLIISFIYFYHYYYYYPYYYYFIIIIIIIIIIISIIITVIFIFIFIFIFIIIIIIILFYYYYYNYYHFYFILLLLLLISFHFIL